MQSRNLQLIIVFLLLACGVLVSATINHGMADTSFSHGSQSALDAPVFSIEHRPGRFELSGTSASSAHENELLQIVTDQFAGSSSQTSFLPGVVLPAQWETSSERLLYALAATDSATATMRGEHIEIRGVTSDAGLLESRLEFLREGVGNAVTIEQDFIVISNTAPLDALCRRNLSHALTKAVVFRQSSAEIRTSSYAVLDKIVGVANDCRDTTIAITGHSDASGSETWNRHLSVVRAQAVADYIIRGGIEPARLLVAGVGSTVPIADNETAEGRGINRRIEFELRQPSLGVAGPHETE